MFRVFYSNFHYFAHDQFDTLEGALAHAKSTCFQAQIYEGDDMVATWCPISGTRHWNL